MLPSGRRIARVTSFRRRFGRTLGDRIETDWIEKCSELLARLHLRSQLYDPPADFHVRAWDEVYAPREEGWLRSFLASSTLDEDAKEIIERAAAQTRTLDLRLPKDRQNYWLIHADFHGDNLIFDGETTWIVDLDDVGWGHFLFDVAWSSVLFAKHHPGSDGALKPLLRGYERVRPLSSPLKKGTVPVGSVDLSRKNHSSERDSPLFQQAASVTQIELLPEFQLAAGIGALEMIHTSPLANDDPLANEWFDFAVRWLQTHLT